MSDSNEVIEEVSNKIESSLVEPITKQDISSTVIVESTIVVDKKLGLTLISESSLSEEQKNLAASIYDSVKLSIQGFINNPNVNNTIKITKTLGQVIKQLEVKASTSANKKAVAIELGRILIKEVIPDDKGESEVLMIYDLIAEETLEAMIEVSRVVNIAVQKIAVNCCPSILELFKRSNN